MAELGALPVAGDRVTYGGLTFTVERMDGMAVDAVVVDLPAPEGASDG